MHAVQHVAAVDDRTTVHHIGRLVQLVMAMRVDREKIASLPALEDGRELV